MCFWFLLAVKFTCALILNYWVFKPYYLSYNEKSQWLQGFIKLYSCSFSILLFLIQFKMFSSSGEVSRCVWIRALRAQWVSTMERDPDPTLGLHRWPVYFREPLAPFTALTWGWKQLPRFMLDSEWSSGGRSNHSLARPLFYCGKTQVFSGEKKTILKLNVFL